MRMFLQRRLQLIDLMKNIHLSTTYLGKIGMKQEDIMKAEESFSISEQGFVMGRILNGEECQILLDTGAINLICQILLFEV